VLGDTASSLGSAVDELMRHQPSLRSEATKAIIKVCRLLSSVLICAQKHRNCNTASCFMSPVFVTGWTEYPKGEPLAIVQESFYRSNTLSFTINSVEV